MKLFILLVVVFSLAVNADTDYQEFDKRQKQISAEVCTRIKAECTVVYSAYTYDKRELPINNINKIALRGSVVVVQKYDKFWGEGKDFKSKVYHNPTWLDLSIVANEMIHVTGDKHHVYLESLEVIKVKKGIQYIELSMGS